MNRKLFIKWQLGKWLPVILVLTILLTITFVIGSLSGAIYPSTTYDNYFSPYNYSSYYIYTTVGPLDPGFNQILSPAMMATFILPLFVYSYRFDKKAADAFGQFPAKRGEIHRIRVLIMLCILLASVSAVFWLGILIRFIRQVTFVPAVNGDLPFYFFNYGYYALFFLYLIVVLAAQFLFNCFICSNVGRAGNSFILMLVAEGILGCFFPLIYGFSAIIVHHAGTVLPNGFPTFQGYSAANPFEMCNKVFGDLICNSEISESRSVGVWDIITWATYPLLLGATAVPLFLQGDPSGEKFGRSGGFNKLGDIIIHIFGGMAGFAIGMGCYLAGFSYFGSIIIFLIIFLYGIIFLTYYLVLALYHRSFRLSNGNLLVFIAIACSSFLMGIIMAVIATTHVGS